MPKTRKGIKRTDYKKTFKSSPVIVPNGLCGKNYLDMNRSERTESTRVRKEYLDDLREEERQLLAITGTKSCWEMDIFRC